MVEREMDWKREFKKGIKSGLPIGIGYIPVSFTFGFLAVSGGLPIWVAAVISLTNLTSAGQFAGTNLIFAGAGYLEVALTTFVINIRYMLMSLSLSQKLERKTGTLARLVMAFGITDETFVVGSLRQGTLTAPFMLGLILMPIAGWNLGTLMGMYFCPASPGASECHGYCSVRYVYCFDYTGSQSVCPCALHHLHSSSSAVRTEVYSSVFFPVRRISRNYFHSDCRRTGRMAFSRS